MSKRDYYEVLEVSRAAATVEIRHAYRRLARRYSPDVNIGDVRSEDLFQEVMEAYRILSDPATRSLYDQLGHRAFETPGEGLEESRARGDDIHYPIELDLPEALEGVATEIEMSRLSPCPACRSTGGLEGASATPCHECQGRAGRSTRATRGQCPGCHGVGWKVPPPCPACRGRGIRPEPCRLSVVIPPGVDTGAQVRIPGQGHAAAGIQGTRGDLIVITRVRPHPLFTRKGDHLHCEVPVTVPEAGLGARIEIPTPDGPARVTIPAGTQSGQVLRLRGRGCPRLGREGRGDLLVQVRVVIPRNPDPPLEEILQALRRLLPEDPRAELWSSLGHRTGRTGSQA